MTLLIMLVPTFFFGVLIYYIMSKLVKKGPVARWLPLAVAVVVSLLVLFFWFDNLGESVRNMP